MTSERSAKLAPLLNLRDRFGALATLSERWIGLSARRSLPSFRSDWFGDREIPATASTGRPVVLFADTFNRHFEPENLRAAVRVLDAAGYRVAIAQPADGGRSLCCGRTLLSAGMVEFPCNEEWLPVNILSKFT